MKNFKDIKDIKYKIMIIFVLFGALNFGSIGLCNINLIEKLGKLINLPISNYLYIVIGLCGLCLLFQNNICLSIFNTDIFSKPKTFFNDKIIKKTFSNQLNF